MSNVSILTEAEAKVLAAESQALARTKADYETAHVGLIPRNYDEALTIAKAFALSGLFKDAAKANLAVVKILMGAEFGMTPVAAMNGIHIVEGKMQLSGTSIGAIIRKSKMYDYRIRECTSEKCSIEFFMDGESLGIESFDAMDAKRQDTGQAGGRSGKSMMEKFPKNMLFNRAMSNGAKFFCPDVFGGQPVYTEGEIQDAEFEDRSNEHKSTADRVRAQLASRQAPQLGERAEQAPPADEDTPYEPDPEFHLEGGE